MFSNYFFIPANKSRHIKKSEEITGIDHRIFDFEDSILYTDIDGSLNLLESVVRRETDWIRIPLNRSLFDKIVTKSLDMGYHNFVIPKFKTCEHVSFYMDQILQLHEHAKFILLIEHPRAFLEIESILQKYSSCVSSIGLGSHDFSLETGLTNNMEYYRMIRINLLLIAKAYDIEPIDVVSMNISDKKAFDDEIKEGFHCGYRSKFLIHPFQLHAVKSFPFYSFEEVEKYLRILRYYESNVQGRDALFSYEGTVYEKMHIKQFEKIVHWGLEFYGTDR